MTTGTIARGLVAGAIVLALAGALAGCSTVPATEVAEDVAQPSPTPTAPPTSMIEVPVARATLPPPRDVVAPVRLSIAAIGVNMPVIAVGVEPGRFMELPEDPAVGGWYRFGSAPSSADGNTVISAHVDSPAYPIGPLSRLRDLSGGEIVEVVDDAGVSHEYRVDAVTSYPKAALPVEDLFSRAGTDRLVLITCGGEFDRTTGRYADNVVAIATPVA